MLRFNPSGLRFNPSGFRLMRAKIRDCHRTPDHVVQEPVSRIFTPSHLRALTSSDRRPPSVGPAGLQSSSISRSGPGGVSSVADSPIDQQTTMREPAAKAIEQDFITSVHFPVVDALVQR